MAKRPDNIKGAQLSKYGKLVEKYLGKGKTVEQAHKIASSPIMLKRDVFDKPSLLDKVILKRLRRKKAKKDKANMDTLRTKDVETKLTRSGLTKKELRRLRGKE